MIKAPAGRFDWTQAKLDALVFRPGFCFDATPNVGIHAIYGEVCMRVGDLVEVNVVEGLFYVHLRLDPDSSGVISIIFTSNSPTRGLSWSYTANGVPDSGHLNAGDPPLEIIVGATDISMFTDWSVEPDPES